MHGDNGKLFKLCCIVGTHKNSVKDEKIEIIYGCDGVMIEMSCLKR